MKSKRLKMAKVNEVPDAWLNGEFQEEVYKMVPEILIEKSSLQGQCIFTVLIDHTLGQENEKEATCTYDLENKSRYSPLPLPGVAPRETKRLKAIKGISINWFFRRKPERTIS